MDTLELEKVQFIIPPLVYRDFPNLVFWPILTLQKCSRVIFRVLCENLTYKTCIAALNHGIFLFDLFHLVT